MYPALGYSATYMLCTHNSPWSKRQYDSVMLAFPPRMDLISDPERTKPAVKSSVRKYVYDAFLFLISTAMGRSYGGEGWKPGRSCGTCSHV